MTWQPPEDDKEPGTVQPTRQRVDDLEGRLLDAECRELILGVLGAFVEGSRVRERVNVVHLVVADDLL